jgi:L-fuculose-phosphate aldolase
MKPASESTLPAGLVEAVRQLDTLGLNRGSTGNVSLRSGGGLLITPTGASADSLSVDDLVFIARDGGMKGRWQPSSEWPFHRAIYQAREDVQAVVHTHSTYATALACLRRPLPAFHYMVALAGGDSVPCVPYHLFGSQALSDAVVGTLAERDACLLANHGLVACGASLAQAMKVAIEIEALCQTYLAALAVAEPTRLSAAEMSRVLDKFETYGKTALRG